LSGTTDDYGRLFTKFNIANKIIVELLSNINGHIVLQVRLTNFLLCAKYFTSDNMNVARNQDVLLNVWYVDSNP
jgi:hypothetical protein